MFLSNISVSFFRNYSDLNLNFDLDKNINVIIAKNGMGKSNLLEIIYYLSHVRPFRNVTDSDLIKNGNDSFNLNCEFYYHQFRNNINIKYKNKQKKEILLNNKKVHNHSEILGKMISVLFSNDDLKIITGSPSERRRFFDIFFSILSSDYLAYLKQYKSIIKQKNYLLKNYDYNMIKIYNTQLSNVIFNLNLIRNKFVNEINNLYSEYYNKIGKYKKNIKIVINNSINKEILENIDSINNFFNNKIAYEKEKGYSYYGYHRDDINFKIDGYYFNKYASLGQIRLAALVIKIIQAKMYEKKYNAKPILLLDDVILELDPEKQSKFINFIGSESQFFLTVTDEKFLDFVNDKNKLNIIRINDGKIS